MKRKTTISLTLDGNLKIHIPVRLKRKAGRKIIIAPEALDGIIPNAPVPEQNAIVESIAKAYQWTKLLETGQVSSIPELVHQLKLSRPYVMRILSLANLAPDIVDAITYGREPDGLSLNKLYKGIPDDWQKQRELFGFQL